MGREGASLNTFEQIIARPRVVYRVTNDRVFVVAVFGPGRNR